VLDVGCGTGATTLAIARQLGGAGQCTGVDLSVPMIALAQARAAELAGPAPQFIEADAQTWPFATGAFDLVVSRLGVMFFDDPVRAFANLRRATAAGGALRCIAWRSPEENPFMTAPEQAVAPHLPALPPRVADAAGQFGFADAARVRAILEQSGWNAVEVRALDVECAFPHRDLATYVARMGPAGSLVQQAPEPRRSELIAMMQAACAPYIDGDTVRFKAACWSISAQAATPGAAEPVSPPR
jgi:SAM-dependent methyltransferase